MYTTFLTITTLLGVNSLSCSNELKQGPFKLEIPLQKLPNITKPEFIFKKFNLSGETEDMIIGYRAKWMSYCYNGGPLDSNTGCYNSLIPYPPTAEELDKWSRQDKCEICNDVSDAWGSDASICLKPTKSCGVWTEGKELTKESTNNHFAYHTCTISWRCGVSNTKIPIIMRLKKDIPVLYVALPNGTLKQQEKFFNIDGYTSVSLPNEIRIQESWITTKCVREENEDFWCIDPDTHTSIHVSSDEESYCRYGTCYLMSRIKESERNFHQYLGQIKHVSDEDFKGIFAHEMMEIEETKYTLLQVAHRMIVLENMFLKLINSVAKIDDKLIPEILGGSFSTEFVNNQAFFIKPCLNVDQPSSNCIGDKIYQDGRWVSNKNKANCVSLKNVKPLNLFEILEVWLPEIAEQKVVGTAEDYSGWSFFANSKQSLTDTMMYTKNGGKGTSIEDVVNMPKGSLANLLLGGLGLSISSIIFITIGACTLIIICKKL